MIIRDRIINLVSSCGIYCGPCPSYGKGTYFGCKLKDRIKLIDRIIKFDIILKIMINFLVKPMFVYKIP